MTYIAVEKDEPGTVLAAKGVMGSPLETVERDSDEVIGLSLQSVRTMIYDAMAIPGGEARSSQIIEPRHGDRVLLVLENEMTRARLAQLIETAGGRPIELGDPDAVAPELKNAQKSGVAVEWVFVDAEFGEEDLKTIVSAVRESSNSNEAKLVGLIPSGCSTGTELLNEAGFDHLLDEPIGEQGVRGVRELLDGSSAGLGSPSTALNAVVPPSKVLLAEYDEAPARLLVGKDLVGRKRAEMERLRLDEQMRHTQRLESLGVLAGGIAHDFNNLLVGILGNTGLALMDLAADDPIRDGIVQIEVAANRAAELTEQILTFAGKGSTTLREVNLSELASEMGQLLSSAISKEAQVSYKLPSSLPALLGDPGQLRQVVMNLIMNASDALGGESGSISVETGTTVMGADDFRLASVCGVCTPGRYVYLEVIDDGCGMSDDVRSRMFDPFFTTKSTGRGLGMAATLGIIRSHGGVVEIESAQGEGTHFRILFPAHESTPEKKSSPSQAPSPSWTTGARFRPRKTRPNSLKGPTGRLIS